MPHPNLVSIVRALLGLLIVKLAGEQRFRLAFAALAAGQLSDPLDGFIARKTGRSSKLGAQIDLVSDSVLTFGSFLGLVRAGVVPLRLVAAFALMAAFGQYVIQPKTGLPLVLIGSLGYYVFGTLTYARLARIRSVPLFAGSGLAAIFIVAMERNRFRELLTISVEKQSRET